MAELPKIISVDDHVVEPPHVWQDRLPAKLRIPWVLSRIADESLPDVAVLCETSLATVKRRIALAEERLARPTSDLDYARARISLLRAMARLNVSRHARTRG